MGGEDKTCSKGRAVAANRSTEHHSVWGLQNGGSGVLGSSGRAVNSLDFYPASLKSLSCFHFQCVFFSQWKALTVNL